MKDNRVNLSMYLLIILMSITLCCKRQSVENIKPDYIVKLHILSVSYKADPRSRITEFSIYSGADTMLEITDQIRIQQFAKLYSNLDCQKEDNLRFESIRILIEVHYFSGKVTTLSLFEGENRFIYNGCYSCEGNCEFARLICSFLSQKHQEDFPKKWLCNERYRPSTNYLREKNGHL